MARHDSSSKKLTLEFEKLVKSTMSPKYKAGLHNVRKITPGQGIGLQHEESIHDKPTLSCQELHLLMRRCLSDPADNRIYFVACALKALLDDSCDELSTNFCPADTKTLTKLIADLEFSGRPFKCLVNKSTKPAKFMLNRSYKRTLIENPKCSYQLRRVESYKGAFGGTYAFDLPASKLRLSFSTTVRVFRRRYHIIARSRRIIKFLGQAPQKSDRRSSRIRVPSVNVGQSFKCAKKKTQAYVNLLKGKIRIEEIPIPLCLMPMSHE